MDNQKKTREARLYTGNHLDSSKQIQTFETTVLVVLKDSDLQT
jgi:hypothetical protein